MLKALQKALNTSAFDALLLTSEANRRYATGMATSAGIVLITKKRGCFFTDSRYIEAARQRVSGFEVKESVRGSSYSRLVNEACEKDRVKKLAFEDLSMTCSSYESWKHSLAAALEPMGSLLSILRSVKTEEETAAIVRAQRMAENAFKELLNEIKPGVTEKHLAARLTYLMLEQGAENMSFDPIVVSGKKSSMPHGVPSEKPLENGDFVTMDFGCIADGYCSDMTRTVAVGYATEEMQQIYQTVLDAQLAGIAAARAGVTAGEVDSAGRAVIEKAGWGDFFGHGFGHGVGLEIHEEPTVGTKNPDVLQSGQVVTAEPGIYLPGKFGVRIEDMLKITDDGSVNLTHAPKELLILK